jgi:hypothetical protein
MATDLNTHDFTPLASATRALLDAIDQYEGWTQTGGPRTVFLLVDVIRHAARCEAELAAAGYGPCRGISAAGGVLPSLALPTALNAMRELLLDLRGGEDGWGSSSGRLAEVERGAEAPDLSGHLKALRPVASMLERGILEAKQTGGGGPIAVMVEQVAREVGGKCPSSAILLRTPEPAAPPSENLRPTEPPGPPKCYLQNWAEIVQALPGLKNIKNHRERLKRLNDKRGGPIKVGGRGESPIVEKGALLDWWNHLDAHLHAQVNSAASARETVKEQYLHGRNGQVVPGINGHVKTRDKAK